MISLFNVWIFTAFLIRISHSIRGHTGYIPLSKIVTGRSF
jgi:hypothetical protein